MNIQKSFKRFSGVFFFICLFLFFSIPFSVLGEENSIPPEVVSVTVNVSDPDGRNGFNESSRFYQNGDVIQFTVVFSEEIKFFTSDNNEVTDMENASQIPYLQFRSRKNLENAKYNSGINTNTLIFTYQVDETKEKINSWDGIVVEKFKINGGYYLGNNEKTALEKNIANVDFSEVFIDSSDPIIKELRYDRRSSSSENSIVYGNLHDGIRYFNANDKISTFIVLQEKDTRSPLLTSVTTSIGGVEAGEIVYGGSNISGNEPDAQSQTPLGFFDGKNGVFTLTSATWTDKSGKTGSGSQPVIINESGVSAYIIDTTAPEIHFDDDVSGNKVQEESVRVTIGEENLLFLQYAFSNDSICDENDTYQENFLSGATLLFSRPEDSEQYICIKAEDKAGNVSYKSSSASLQIVLPAPVITPSDEEVNNKDEEKQQKKATPLASSQKRRGGGGTGGWNPNCRLQFSDISFQKNEVFKGGEQISFVVSGAPNIESFEIRLGENPLPLEYRSTENTSDSFFVSTRIPQPQKNSTALLRLYAFGSNDPKFCARESIYLVSLQSSHLDTSVNNPSKQLKEIRDTITILKKNTKNIFLHFLY